MLDEIEGRWLVCFCQFVHTERV